MLARAVSLAGLLLSLGSQAARAQGVVIAPHALYLEHRTRSASLTLYNPGAAPAEVGISFFYGYPVTDSLGHFELFSPDSVEPGMPSALGWIDAFPRRVTIPPLARQTIRLLARPPQGLADGEYWSRILISAKGAPVQVAAADSAGISIGLNLEVRTILPVIYRKGSLATGIKVSGLRAAVDGDSLVVRARLERQGNGAYIGSARGTLLASGGVKVASFDQPVAVYYDAEPRFTIPLQGQAAGDYTLRLELVTERTDLQSETVLRSPPVSDSVAVRVP